MPYEQKDNSVCLFKNKEKTREEDPGWKGSAKVNGVEYWASGWVNKRRETDEKWLNIALKRKEPSPTQNPAGEPDQDFKDDIPF